MRNAYQFLMMSAGIILGVLLLSTLVYVFRAGGRASQNVNDEQLKQQLIADNAEFEFYNKPNNTVSDIISLCNLVYDFNEKNDYDPEYTIKLVIQIGTDANHLSFVIPATNSRAGQKLAKKQLFKNDDEFTTDTISVYDFAENSDIVVSGSVSFTNGAMEGIAAAAGDTLSITRLDNSSDSKTIYKYLFDCAEIRYNIKSGRPEYIIFKARINPDY